MNGFVTSRLLTGAGILVAALVAWHALSHSADAPAHRDWPMLGGGPQRNAVNLVAHHVPTQWSIKENARKNIKWVMDLGTISYGGPTVAGGRVFVGTNNGKPRAPQIKEDRGILMCFRESDGKFLWQAVHDKLPNAQENDWPQQGIASTPAVDGNRVYYVSNRCELICADVAGFHGGKNQGVQDEKYKGPHDADIIWRLDMMNGLHVFPRELANCSPLVVGDLVFVTTGNGVNGEHKVIAPEAPSFLAVNKHTGRVVWQSNAPGANILDGQWSNPAYAVVDSKPQVIFAGGDGWVRGFEAATGKPLWKFDCNAKGSLYKPGGGGTRNSIVATPVVHENRCYIGVGRDPDNEGPGAGDFWCIDITKTGDLSPVANNFDPKASVNKNSGLVWHYGGPAPKDADRRYLFGRTLSSAVIQDGLVYVADLDGFVYCFDAKTGQKYWDEDLKASVWGSPLWVDGKVYLGDDNGDVHIFAAGKVKNIIGKVEMEEPIKSTPVVADGVLYIMTGTHLYAIVKP